MQYDMVFEGGGAKGMVFVGAMQEFTRRGHSHARLLGTSAGAITATLLAAGYSDLEMLEALAEKHEGQSVFSAFMGLPAPLPAETLEQGSLKKIFDEIDLPLLPEAAEKKLDAAILAWLSRHPLGRHLLSFIERGGWYSADAFVTWMTDRLNTGRYQNAPRQFGSATLAEFYAATGKDLSLVASDSSAGMKLVMNHRTAPNLPLVWAVRMSMSIPFLWQEVIWQPGWGRYRGQDINGHAIVDGGLISNFPIELFISDLKPVTDVMGPRISTQVLGMLIDEKIPVPNAPPPDAAPASSTEKINIAELGTVKRILNLVNTMLEAGDKAVVTTFEDLVVRLPAGGYGTTEFNMNDDRRAALLEAGRKAMKTYLDRMEAKSLAFDVTEFEQAPTPQDIADQIATKMLE